MVYVAPFDVGSTTTLMSTQFVLQLALMDVLRVTVDDTAPNPMEDIQVMSAASCAASVIPRLSAHMRFNRELLHNGEGLTLRLLDVAGAGSGSSDSSVRTLSASSFG